MNLLEKLPGPRNADHLSGSHNTCHPGTRADILEQLEVWADDPSVLCVYWLAGHAGSGKSTIAQSFCHRTYATGKLGASFFCSRDFVDRSDINLSSWDIDSPAFVNTCCIFSEHALLLAVKRWQIS